MILRKLKFCQVCQTPQYIWKSSGGISTCKSCSVGNYKPPQQTKNKKTIHWSSDKRKTIERLKMRFFFNSQQHRIPERCENCQEPFGFIMPQQKHFIMAHILPKKDKAFPSVKYHPDNLMFLCTANGCHHKWDFNSTQEERRNMPCYPVAMERVEKFYNELTDHEQVLLTKYL